MKKMYLVTVWWEDYYAQKERLTGISEYACLSATEAECMKDIFQKNPNVSEVEISPSFKIDDEICDRIFN